VTVEAIRLALPAKRFCSEIVKSHLTQRYGASFLPQDMTIQDWGITFDDLEPHYDKFEYLCGTSGTAGMIKGQIQDGGIPFEGPRSRPYPTPAQKQPFSHTLVCPGRAGAKFRFLRSAMQSTASSVLRFWWEPACLRSSSRTRPTHPVAGLAQTRAAGDLCTNRAGGANLRSLLGRRGSRNVILPPTNKSESIQFAHSVQCLPPQKTFHLSYGVLIEATGFRHMGRRQNAPPPRSRKL
jgi:hypothetical protein